MARLFSSHPGGVLAIFSCAWVATASEAPAADFIRGDANGDRSVSISDAYAILANVFWGAGLPDCEAASDIKEDGEIGIADAVRLLNYLFLNGPQPGVPFPAPGPDPDPDLPCNVYGNEAPLEDAEARIRVLDATAPGGEDRRVTVTLACSSSREIGGLAGSLRSGARFDASGTRLEELTGSYPDSFRLVRVSGDSLRFGFLTSLVDDLRIPAGTDASLVEITFCLEGGTVAGEYPLTLEAGELVDAETSLAIHPALENGFLTVLSDVDAAGICIPDLPDEPPPPEDIDVELRLGSTVVGEDRSFQVPVVLRANVPVMGFTLSIDFDEDVLEATSFSDFWQRPDGQEYGLRRFRANNQRSNPGNGLDEGVVTFTIVYDLDTEVTLPPETDNEIATIHFNVLPDATEGATELRFMDSGVAGGQPVKNTVTAYATTYYPDLGSSFVFISGFVNVLPDGALFIRGDSNGDGTVNISDPQHTLGYLFLGEDRPFCYDAADTTDDGAIDMSDAIATFGFLFLGTGPLPAPHGAPGEDPTPDGLGCLRRSEG